MPKSDTSVKRLARKLGAWLTNWAGPEPITHVFVPHPLAHEYSSNADRCYAVVFDDGFHDVDHCNAPRRRHVDAQD